MNFKMRRYTYQLFVAGYAEPQGTDVHYAENLDELKGDIQREHDQAQRYGAGYEPTEALIWHGKHTDVTDQYPDKIATMGPRGGVRISPA